MKAKRGAEAKEFIVGYDALAVYVHKDNPLDDIASNNWPRSTATAARSPSGRSWAWNITAGQRRDHPRQPPEQLGNVRLLPRGDLGKPRDYKLQSIDQSGSKDVVALVSKTPGAIGYSGMGYNMPGVKMLRIAKQRASRASRRPWKMPRSRASIPLPGRCRSTPPANRWERRSNTWIGSWRPRASGCAGAGLRTRASMSRSMLRQTGVRAKRGTRRRVYADRCRSCWTAPEPAVEWVIRLCGWSADLFVFAIFFFVFREAACRALAALNLAEFFTSPKWQPTSEPSRTSGPWR